MNRSVVRKRVRNLIGEVLQEQNEPTKAAPTKEEPTEAAPTKEEPAEAAADEVTLTVAKGAYGTGGRFKQFVREADARALHSPKKLLRDLGVTSGVTGEDVDQVKRILDLAIHSNDVMRSAYGGAAKAIDQMPNGEQVEGVGVHLAELDQRNGIKFLMHTLMAAKRAGFLTLKGSMVLNKGKKAPIIIYSA
jgi:hypothetical protein